MARTRSADPPNGLAPLLRVRPELQDYCRFGGDWRAPHDAINAAQFHIVTRGQCVIERPGLGHIRLSKGDILLLPHGNAHIVRAAKADGQAPRPIMVDYSSAIRSKTTEGVEPETEIVCGVLRFESATENYIASTLPNIVVLHSCEGPVVDRFRMIMLGIRGELDGSRPGGIVIATDSACALFAMMLHEYLEEPSVREPAEQPTFASLAAAADTSRTTIIHCLRRIAGVATFAAAPAQAGSAQRDDPTTHYGGGAKGYTDYPSLEQERGEAPKSCVDDHWR